MSSLPKPVMVLKLLLLVVQLESRVYIHIRNKTAKMQWYSKLECVSEECCNETLIQQ